MILIKGEIFRSFVRVRADNIKKTSPKYGDFEASFAWDDFSFNFSVLVGCRRSNHQITDLTRKAGRIGNRRSFIKQGLIV